jgi:hypothetical protein
MKTIQDYASLILIDEPVRVKRSTELNDKFTTMANEIYRCPVRNKNKRDYTNVMHSVEKVVVEHALAHLTGMTLNPAEFNYKDRNSYAWDVVDEDTSATFECKRWSESWLSFHPENFSTFFKNTDIVDYLVSGKVFKTSEYFTVAFHLIADADSFEKYVRPSQYDNKCYYDHNRAARNGDAVFKNHVYFQGDK